MASPPPASVADVVARTLRSPEASAPLVQLAGGRAVSLASLLLLQPVRAAVHRLPWCRSREPHASLAALRDELQRAPALSLSADGLRVRLAGSSGADQPAAPAPSPCAPGVSVVLVPANPAQPCAEALLPTGGCVLSGLAALLGAPAAAPGPALGPRPRPSRPHSEPRLFSAALQPQQLLGADCAPPLHNVRATWLCGASVVGDAALAWVELPPWGSQPNSAPVLRPVSLADYDGLAAGSLPFGPQGERGGDEGDGAAPSAACKQRLAELFARWAPAAPGCDGGGRFDTAAVPSRAGAPGDDAAVLARGAALAHTCALAAGHPWAAQLAAEAAALAAATPAAAPPGPATRFRCRIEPPAALQRLLASAPAAALGPACSAAVLGPPTATKVGAEAAASLALLRRCQAAGEAALGLLPPSRPPPLQPQQQQPRAVMDGAGDDDAPGAAAARLFWPPLGAQRRAFACAVLRWAAPRGVLDLGCGDGALLCDAAAALAAAGPDDGAGAGERWLVGLELSERRAAAAAARLAALLRAWPAGALQQQTPLPRARVLCGSLLDAAAAALPPGAADVVLCVEVRTRSVR